MAKEGRRQVTHGVQVSPRTAQAVAWLNAHRRELSEAFKRVHRGPKSNHPHGASVLLLPVTAEDFFEPGKGPSYLYLFVSAHGDDEHLDTTMEDVKTVLKGLGADDTQFSFRKRATAEDVPGPGS